MQFSIKTLSPGSLKTGCALVPVVGGKLTAGGLELDRVLDGRLQRALKTGDLDSKAGSTQMLSTGSGIERVLLASFGEAPAVTEKAFFDGLRSALRALAATASRQAVSLFAEVAVEGHDERWKIRNQVLAVRDTRYRFEQMKSKPGPAPRGPESLTFAVSAGQASGLKSEVSQAIALADGIDLARDLGNLPGNVCTPTYLANQARKLGKAQGLKVEVLDRKRMQSLGMGALLAVAQGSEEPPQFIVMHYQGAPAREAPVVLVGKGITFDTGGISIKPAGDMDQMKFDMCGAASVLGTMQAIAAIGPRINVIGVIPTCENMPSGRATRPGDVVKTMSGQTVEILNTDAEGRLILCDALTYVERFKPQAVIDIATLTGACVVALGHHHSGLFSPSDTLADGLLRAGREMGDTCWRMPLDEPYHESLKSNFADVANVGGRDGGAVTAACFLARFATAYEWAHLDIAGTAWKSGQAKGASGRPVPLLARFVLERAGADARR